MCILSYAHFTYAFGTLYIETCTSLPCAFHICVTKRICEMHIGEGHMEEGYTFLYIKREVYLSVNTYTYAKCICEMCLDSIKHSDPYALHLRNLRKLKTTIQLSYKTVLYHTLITIIYNRK